MVSMLSQLELCSMDRMTRQELMAAIRARGDIMPTDLLGQLEEQPTRQLQLLLLLADCSRCRGTYGRIPPRPTVPVC